MKYTGTLHWWKRIRGRNHRFIPPNQVIEADLADDLITARWREESDEQGTPCNCRLVARRQGDHFAGEYIYDGPQQGGHHICGLIVDAQTPQAVIVTGWWRNETPGRRGYGGWTFILRPEAV
jgi:hypothetical protein